MKQVKQKISLILLLLFGFTNASANFNEGIVAYLMGDYERAFAIMQSLGNTANHGYAQYYLGMMYLQGQGTKQDDKNAGEWFRKAAENRVPQAQYKLGELYMQGRSVPKDYEFAYAWLSVGAAHKHSQSTSMLAQAKAKLTEQELFEAEKLAADLTARYGPEEGLDPTKPIHLK